MIAYRSNVINLALLLLGTLSLYTANPLETVWSVILAGILLRWFFWKEEPAIILLFIATPYIEIHTSLFEANNYGLSLNELFPDTGGTTFWISSTSLFTVSTVLHLCLKKWPHLIPPKQALQAAASQYSQTKLILAYVLLLAISRLIDANVSYGSSLSQLETFSAASSNIFLIMIALHYWITKERPLIFFGLFLIVTISSFYSYFSEWKTPLTILLVTLTTTLKRIDLLAVIRAVPLIASIVTLVFLWQSVKGEYREFLSQGNKSQEVNVDRSTALNKFQELSLSALETGIVSEEVVASTYRRAGYLEYFSDVLRKVPSQIEHERGMLIAESASFALIPRIINPNKGVKNDRVKVERYTDYFFGYNSFASFSLGHYCEAYIDWGAIGMQIQMLLYGVLGAILIYSSNRYYRESSAFLMYGIIFALMTPWGTFQQDSVTVIGSIVWGSFCHLILFRPLYRWINQFAMK